MTVHTPGVYIKEKSVLSTSIDEVLTAVPLFIGYTAYAQKDPIRITSMDEFESAFGENYTPHFTVKVNTTTNEVDSLVPDKRFFLYDTLSLYFKNEGGPCYVKSSTTDTYDTVTSITNFNDFFDEGIDTADTLDEVTLILIPDLHLQFKNDDNELSSVDESIVYQKTISQLINKCGELQDKFAILDFHQPDSLADHIRGLITPDANKLKYGAIYYPWLKNTVTHQVTFSDLSLDVLSGSLIESEVIAIHYDLTTLALFFDDHSKEVYDQLKSEITANSSANVINFSKIIKLLYGIIVRFDIASNPAHPYFNTQPNSYGRLLKNPVLKEYVKALQSNSYLIENIKKLYRFKGINTSNIDYNAVGFPGPANPFSSAWLNNSDDNYSGHQDVEIDTSLLPDYTINSKTIVEITNDLDTGEWVDLDIIFSSLEGLREAAYHQKQELEKQLFINDPVYTNIQATVENYMKQIPSQGAVAGAYCKNDKERGVWKSPANIAIQSIEKPTTEVTNGMQDLLNVDASTGKSINVIRSFTGKGPLIWGARTLAGNDSEWRYIAVRRFFNFAEETIKKALFDLVFEPNNKRTWVKIKAIAISFLVKQWRAGALAGATMEEAFFVEVGNETTTPEEILEGKINIKIGIAVARPAEFIVIQFIQLLSQ